MSTADRAATIKKVALLTLLAVLLACAWLPFSQAAAREYSADGLKRALATYAAAKAINALISVAQSTQVSIQPGGVGVATNPGEVLDPLNDLIEQFSSLMLMSTVVFGAQVLLTDAGAHHYVNLALSVLLVAYGVALTRTGGSPHWLAKSLVVLLVFRFAVPVSVVASEAVHRAVFKEQSKCP